MWMWYVCVWYDGSIGSFILNFQPIVYNPCEYYEIRKSKEFIPLEPQK